MSSICRKIALSITPILTSTVKINISNNANKGKLGLPLIRKIKIGLSIAILNNPKLNKVIIPTKQKDLIVGNSLIGKMIGIQSMWKIFDIFVSIYFVFYLPSNFNYIFVCYSGILHI